MDGSERLYDTTPFSANLQLIDGKSCPLKRHDLCLARLKRPLWATRDDTHTLRLQYIVPQQFTCFAGSRVKFRFFIAVP